jgi:hypothetical protein
MLSVLPKILFPQQKELVTYNILKILLCRTFCEVQFDWKVDASILFQFFKKLFLCRSMGFDISSYKSKEYSPLFLSLLIQIFDSNLKDRNNKITSVFLVSDIFKPAHDSNLETIPLSSCLFISTDVLVEVLKIWYMPLCSTE